MKLNEIAERITEHLKRFEADKKINKLDSKHKTRPYYNAWARRVSNRIRLSYVSYHGTTSISKKQAERYLAWLDAGNVGKFHKCRDDREFKHTLPPQCAGCGVKTSSWSPEIRVGKEKKVQVCAGKKQWGSGYEPKKACLTKARAKLALCPGCDAVGVEPGTLCDECHEIIDRGQCSDHEPKGYFLSEKLLGPYLGLDDNAKDLLVLLCRIAAPEGARRWTPGGFPDWAKARDMLGADTDTDRATSGSPAVELDESQKEALEKLGETIEKLAKAQRLAGVNEGSSILHNLANGKTTIGELTDKQIRAEKLYGESE